nr:ionotropic receptor 41c.1 [Graphosoma rubrolineatum]
MLLCGKSRPYASQINFKIRKMKLVLLLILLICRLSTGIEFTEDVASKSLSKLVSKIFLDMPECVQVVLSDFTFLKLPSNFVYLRVQYNSSNLFSSLRASYKMKCMGYLIDENSANDFLTTLGEARSSALERHTPRIVVVPNRRGNYSANVFMHPESKYIPDMIVIQIIADSKCETGVEMELMTNSFHNKSIFPEGERLGVWPVDEIVFFPDKLSNLNGKELIIAALHYPPYVLLPEFDGLDVRIVYEFCQLYNCKLSPLADDHKWGEIFTNGTGTGVSGNVYMDYADIGIGALTIWANEYKYIDFSHPYLESKAAVLVPKPAQKAEWRIPFLPFSLTLWVLQVLSIILAAVILILVNNVSSRIAEGLMLGGEFATRRGIFLRAYAMALLQPPPSRLPASSPLRRFFTIFEVLFLFFTTVYSGALSSVLTVPLYYPPIDSPLQLYEAGIPWAADHMAWIFSIQDATEQPLKGLVERFEVHSHETLISLLKKSDYGFIIEIMPGGHLTQTEYLSGEAILNHHVMKHDLYTASLNMCFRKGSPYTEKLNKLIGKCLDAGLSLLWETDVTLTYLSTRIQTALKISEGTKVEAHHPTKLKLTHIQGAFILLVFGLFVSFGVFMLEKLGDGPSSLMKIHALWKKP